jgi:predicted RNA-binding Zn-ribbon protein involved in translation (DUF1610 family)
MDDRREPYRCPDCGRPLRRLVPPAGLDDLAAELFKCPECVVLADRLGERVECARVLYLDGRGALRTAPDVTQWLLADE